MIARSHRLRTPVFGRRRPFMLDGEAIAAPAPAIRDDIKLFAANFVAGFLFVAVYLA